MKCTACDIAIALGCLGNTGLETGATRTGAAKTFATKSVAMKRCAPAAEPAGVEGCAGLRHGGPPALFDRRAERHVGGSARAMSTVAASVLDALFETGSRHAAGDADNALAPTAGLRVVRPPAAKARPAAEPVVRTRCVETLAGVTRAAAEARVFALVSGGAGLGKSAAARAAAASVRGARLVTCSADTRNARGMLAAIAESCTGINGAVATSHSGLLRATALLIAGETRVLIVDEAHQCSPASFDALRSVYDAVPGGVGVVLLATSAIARKLDGERDPLLLPLLSRVAVRVDLDRELRVGPGWIGAGHVVEIVERGAGVELDDDAAALLVRQAFRPPYLRGAVNAARVAKALGGGGAERVRLTGAAVAEALELACFDASKSLRSGSE